MTPTPTNGTLFRLDNLTERVKELESQNIAVIADRVARLSTLVSWMIASFVTLILSTLCGIIVFLVTQS